MRHRRGARLARRPRRATLARRRNSAARSSRAGGAARTITTPSGACAAPRRTSPAPARCGNARACAEALSAIAASAGHPDALAALADALAAIALAEGDTAAALQQLGRALALHDELEIPFERAQILLRAGTALARAGQRDDGLERLAEAHRLACRLGAEPLAERIAAAVTATGSSLEERLGSRAAARHAHAGLSRRELEVMRLVAEGLTNRQIAERLVLSTRTVDMHVRSILTSSAAGRAPRRPGGRRSSACSRAERCAALAAGSWRPAPSTGSSWRVSRGVGGTFHGSTNGGQWPVGTD